MKSKHGMKDGKHARAEMRALKRGGAPAAVMANERREYAMANGGMVKGKGKAYGGGSSGSCKPA